MIRNSHLTKIFVKSILIRTMTETASAQVSVLSDAGRLAAVLAPIRRQVLENLKTPDSASGLARKIGLSRQKINYHLRELERAGFVELTEERQRRGCIERYYRVTAQAYVISPEFLENLAADPDEIQDKFSSAYLVATASRVVKDVSTLKGRAVKMDQRLATLTMETEISFVSPADFNAFSEELAGEMARLTAKYHNARSSGRKFRVVIGAHPVVTKTTLQAAREAADHKSRKGKSKS